MKANISEEIKMNSINFELRKMFPDIKNDLRCFFIDNKIHTMSDDEIKSYGAEKELEILDKEVI